VEVNVRTLWSDVRFGCRALLRSPGYTAVAVLVLGLGIGANTAVFSAAYAFLRKPISLPEIDRVLMVLNHHEQRPVSNWEPVAPADYLDWRGSNRSLEELTAYRWGDLHLTGTGTPEKVSGVLASANFFDTLRVQPMLGRTFFSGEDVPGQDQEVILSYGLWKQKFSANPNILGSAIRLDGKVYSVIGVLEKNFNFPAGADLWIPLAMNQREQQDRTHHTLVVFGRLKSETGSSNVFAEFATIENRLRSQYPKDEREWEIKVLPIRHFVATDLTDRFAVLLLGAVSFVLLIACANVANLQFARATGRRKEIAIRSAMGAGRWSIIRQLLTESVLLAMAANILGLIFAVIGIQFLRYYMPAEISRYISAWQHVRIEPEGLLFTLLIAICAGILSGLAPAFQTAGMGIADQLKEGGRSNTAGRSRHILRSLFVVSEIALSVVLLVGAGLMVKGVMTLIGGDGPRDAENILTMRLNLSGSRYTAPRQQAEFYERALRDLQSIPGVDSIASATNVPIGDGGLTTTFGIEGHSLQPGDFRSTILESVSPDDFRMMNVPLLQGRYITNQDGPEMPAVALISNRFAQRYFSGEDPVGKHIRQGDNASAQPWLTVVGVVGDIKYDPWSKQEPPAMYVSYRQFPMPSTYLAIRTSHDALQLAPVARLRLANIDAEQPVYEAQTLGKVISNQVIELSYVAAMVSVLGVIALVLATAGVYAVMSYSVMERVHEIGIRMALGAQRSHVLYLILKRGFLLFLAGLGIGLLFSFGIARLLSSLLFGVNATDASVFTGIVSTMCIVGFLACYIPSRHSLKIDPIVALRSE
jgi:putative ABC transport system permease protein